MTVPGGGAFCLGVGRPGSGALPPPTARPLAVGAGGCGRGDPSPTPQRALLENTLERIAKCRYKTKMNKHSGFWQLHLTAAAQELLGFITPKGRVLKWKVMPFQGG